MPLHPKITNAFKVTNVVMTIFISFNSLSCTSQSNDNVTHKEKDEKTSAEVIKNSSISQGEPEVEDESEEVSEPREINGGSDPGSSIVLDGKGCTQTKNNELVRELRFFGEGNRFEDKAPQNSGRPISGGLFWVRDNSVSLKYIEDEEIVGNDFYKLSDDVKVLTSIDGLDVFECK